MSLNKFVDTTQKQWMNIGCDEIVCNELTIAGQVQRPSSLLFASTLSSYSGTIYPGPETIVGLPSFATGVGSLTIPNPFTTGQQLKISISCNVNSVSATNNVSIYLYPMGVPTVISIPWTGYTTATNIVIESRYTFITPTQASLTSTVYLPTDNIVLNHPLVTFPSVFPYNLSIQAIATSAATMGVVNTTMTVI
jgi:hypothetical protein